MEKVHALMVFEVLGRPATHVTESLNTVISRIESEKGVSISNKRLHEPVKVEKSKDLFTAFAEIEIEVESLFQFIGIIFAYMPANVELIRPEKLALSNYDFNELANKLAQRLHDYDAITKKALLERNIILNKLKEISPEEFEKLTTPSEAQKKQEGKKTKSKSNIKKK